MKRGITLIRLLVAVTVLILSLVYLLPIYVMALTSLKTPLEITQRQYLQLGGNLQPENYTTALGLVFPSVVNSSIISTLR